VRIISDRTISGKHRLQVAPRPLLRLTLDLDFGPPAAWNRPLAIGRPRLLLGFAIGGQGRQRGVQPPARPPAPRVVLVSPTVVVMRANGRAVRSRPLLQRKDRATTAEDDGNSDTHAFVVRLGRGEQ
jgi:hypothetical protein